MNKKAFTLLEIIIAITFIVIVFTAISGLVLSSIMVNSKNKRSVQAMYLAQESLEVMRYIRDSNWLQNYSWNMGANQWGANFALESSEASKEFLLIERDPLDGLWELVPVNSITEESTMFILNDNFPFKRTVIVESFESETEESQDALKITAKVSWDNRGREESVELSSILTNWQ